MRTLFNLNCTECHHEILLYDELLGEIFCEKCGLINADKYSFETIPDMMMKSHQDGIFEARKLNEEMMKEHQE